jgi:hypothetical protein
MPPPAARPHWSDREIAKRAAVSHEFVRRLRPVPDVTVNVDSEARTYTTKHGTVAKMNTAAIGKRSDANGFSGGQVGDLRSLPASQRTASDLIGSVSPVTMWT